MFGTLSRSRSELFLAKRLTFVDSNEVAAQLVQKFGRRIDSFVDGLTHVFPRPEDLAEVDLSLLGIARECAASIKALARGICTNELTLASSRSLQETISKLTSIDGIDEEAAHYIAMRAFGEPDALPLEGALVYWLMPGEPLPSGRALSMAEGWRPWRAYAAMHLWADGAAS